VKFQTKKPVTSELITHFVAFYEDLLDLADFSDFFSVFLSLRSSLFGLHLMQDLPSLWAVMQHLSLHSLPAAAAF